MNTAAGLVRPKVVGSSLTRPYYTSLKKISRDKHSSLFRGIMSDKKIKSFANAETGKEAADMTGLSDFVSGNFWLMADMASGEGDFVVDDDVVSSTNFDDATGRGRAIPINSYKL